MIPFKSMLDQIMWNTPKSVSKVKECYVTCSVLVLCVLDDFVHDNIVFYAAIYARKKCFLKLWVYEFVCCEKCGETFSQNEVIKFANAAGQCYHSEVGWYSCITFLVNEFDKIEAVNQEVKLKETGLHKIKKPEKLYL